MQTAVEHDPYASNFAAALQAAGLQPLAAEGQYREPQISLRALQLSRRAAERTQQSASSLWRSLKANGQVFDASLLNARSLGMHHTIPLG